MYTLFQIMIYLPIFCRYVKKNILFFIMMSELIEKQEEWFP